MSRSVKRAGETCSKNPLTRPNPGADDQGCVHYRQRDRLGADGSACRLYEWGHMKRNEEKIYPISDEVFATILQNCWEFVYQHEQRPGDSVDCSDKKELINHFFLKMQG